MKRSEGEEGEDRKVERLSGRLKGEKINSEEGMVIR